MPNSWLEIDAANLRHNVARIRELVAPSSIMAVVKANAYGAGAVPIARVLAAAGVEAFAVATVEEGIELREAGIRRAIACLTYFARDEVDAILTHDLSPVLFTPDAVTWLNAGATARGRSAQAWIKVDTGLGRIGVPFEAAAQFARTVAKAPGIRIEGLLSTLSENPERNPQQVTRLRQVRDDLADLGRLTATLASSQGLISLPASYLDMVRAGIVLLGIVPGPERADPILVDRLDPRPVVTWKARVAYVKVVPRGEQVGYGIRRPLEQATPIATLAVGWADGYPQGIQGAGPVLLHGRRCPVLAVSANSTMVDVGAVAEIRLDDEAVLVGAQGPEAIPAAEVAPVAGSLYRLLATIPRSVPRVVLRASAADRTSVPTS